MSREYSSLFLVFFRLAVTCGLANPGRHGKHSVAPESCERACRTILSTKAKHTCNKGDTKRERDHRCGIRDDGDVGDAREVAVVRGGAGLLLRVHPRDAVVCPLALNRLSLNKGTCCELHINAVCSLAKVIINAVCSFAKVHLPGL